MGLIIVSSRGGTPGRDWTTDPARRGPATLTGLMLALAGPQLRPLLGTVDAVADGREGA